MRRPRAMVLDAAWRELDGVAPLSSATGGPLRRTVKLMLDPLVIRPVAHPLCAGPLVNADGRWRRAGYVLRARRLTVNPDATSRSRRDRWPAGGHRHRS
ncbi:hypothetical protein [Nocardia callitridis]|uniref:hypothetical protein n=1 Tax=Nocardia callitridis TaxID=648753 RepID=UPI0031ED7B0B